MKTFSILCLVIYSNCFVNRQTLVSNDQILRSAPWTKFSYSVDIDLDGTFDDFSDSCEMDNSFIFLNDTTLIIIDTGQKCDTSLNIDTITMSWQNQNTGIMLGLAGDLEFYELSQICDTSIILHNYVQEGVNLILYEEIKLGKN